jgi:hypothetical protein
MKAFVPGGLIAAAELRQGGKQGRLSDKIQFSGKTRPRPTKGLVRSPLAPYLKAIAPEFWT